MKVMRRLSTELLDRYIAANDGTKTALDLGNVDYVTAPALSNFLAYLFSCSMDGNIRVFTPPKRDTILWRYLIKMRFFTLAAHPHHPAFENADEFALVEAQTLPRLNRYMERLPFLPFMRVVDSTQSAWEFEQECRYFLSKLLDVFRASLKGYYGYSENLTNRFWEPNWEIASNIFEHSGSWGWAAIQGVRKGITISYADLGMGMRKSLARRNSGETPNDASAIQAAFQYGVTRHAEGRGTGLPDTLTFVRKSGGFVECRSGTACLTFLPSDRTSVRRITPSRGVQLSLWLPRVIEL